jgi:hypothetical protein
MYTEIGFPKEIRSPIVEGLINDRPLILEHTGLTGFDRQKEG